MSIQLTVNKKKMSLDIDPNTPLLWALRDHMSLKGTKYGCGIAQCGACTVWVNGEATRSCVLPISAVANADIILSKWLGMS
jgi:isoquinoline 1-oxidoreductase alpha subunit